METSQELIKTACLQGQLIITDTHIKTTGMRTQVMDRNMLTRVDYQKTMLSFFGMRGTGNFVFYGKGTQQLYADAVAHKNAKRVLHLLGRGEVIY